MKPEVERLEERWVPTTINPEPAGGFVGAAGNLVEFRKAPAGFFTNNNDSLAQADALFALALTDSTVIADATDNGVSVINYVDTGGGNLFANPRDVGIGPLTAVKTTGSAGNPNSGTFNPSAEDDEFAMQSSGFIFIPTAGDWTFFTRSDDADRLVMGTDNTVVTLADTPRGPTTDSTVVTVPTAGYYHYQFTWTQGNGGAMAELFAQGPGQANPQLVGDTANGGLAVFQTYDDPLTISGTTISPNEGTQFSGAVATFLDSDPGGSITQYSADINWGDGTPVVTVTSTLSANGQIVANGDGSFSVNGVHTYAEDGSDTITITVHDAGGASKMTTSTATVAENDVTGTVTSVNAVEGKSFTAQVASFSDGGNQQAPGSFTASIDWGDGSTPDTVAVTQPGGSGTPYVVNGTHTYGEESAPEHANSNPYTITVTVTETGVANGTSSGSATASVSEPSVSAMGNFTVTAAEGTDSGSQTVATFTDPGGPEVVGDYSATIAWGDGNVTTGAIAFDSTSHVFTVTGNHTYSAEGSHFITVTISHENSTSQTVTSTANVGQTGLRSAGVAFSAFEFSELTNVGVAFFAHGDGSEPPSDFNATIDWGDRTTTQGMVTTFRGIYVVFQSHTYTDEGTYTITTTVTDGTASTTIQSTATILEELLPDGTRGSASQRWVSELYRDLLHRPVDPVGLATWSRLVDQGVPRSSLVIQLEGSTEYRTILVNQVYHLLLHRDADAAGLRLGLFFLGRGGTVEGLEALLASSPEYFENRGGNTNAGFLSALYQDLLMRGVDSQGQQAFLSALTAGVSRDQVASILLSSPEYLSDLTTGFYQQLLDRQPDTAGLNNYVGALLGGMRDEIVLASLIGSTEHFNKTVS
jgi:hypothetical protein